MDRSVTVENFHRRERVAAILKILSDNPNKVISLGYFADYFHAARSTISEDISIVKDVTENISCGKVETMPGAAGGVKFIPGISNEEEMKFILDLCEKLKSPDRIIPGGFIYMNDIICSPQIARKIGIIIARRFYDKMPDCVLTVETKGIPIAMMTAEALNVPLIIVRRDSKVTEGSTVSINYISGSSKRIQSMGLSKRSVKKGSKCIFVDDFMKAGGTASGIIELMKEFECQVVGTGVIVESLSDNRKIIQNYVPLLKLVSVDEENGIIDISPSSIFVK
jgi:purine operon repressor